MKELQWDNTEYLWRQEQKEKVEWKSARSTGEDMLKISFQLLQAFKIFHQAWETAQESIAKKVWEPKFSPQECLIKKKLWVVTHSF